MTCTGRIIIVRLVLVTVIVWSLIGPGEGSRYHSEDGSKSPRHRHRHRHDVTSVALSRRSHEVDSSRRSPWPQQEDEYEDALIADDDDDEEVDDYETERSRTLYERNYQPSRNAQRSYHSRFEPRYPLRHHQSGHRGNPWYRGGGGEDEAERRRNSRYGGPAGSRGHKFRPGRERIYHEERRRSENPSAGYLSRNDEFDVPEEDIEDEDEADRDNVYERTSRRWRLDEDVDVNSQDHHGTGSGAALRRRNSRRYRPFEHHGMSSDLKGHRARQDPRRAEWKSRGSISAASAAGSSVSSVQRNEDDDWTERRRKTGTIVRGGKRLNRLPIDEPDNDDREEDRNENKESWSNKRSKNNLINRVFNAGDDRKKDNDLDDLDYDDDAADDGETRKGDSRREEEDKEEEEEENIWKEAEDNEDLDDEEEAFDNTNYYKREDEPPYKTFDDIIKSLTSNDPTTPKPTVRREYRNTDIEKYLRKDAYGNIYDSRNTTTGTRDLHDPHNSPRYQSWNAASNKWRSSPRKPDVGTYSNVRESKKFSNSIGDPASWKGNRDAEKKKVHAKLNEPSAKTKTKTKSLEQDYDEDYEDNEKDEDVVKVRGMDNVTEMQADITNAEYVDEENETETDDETSAPLVTSPPTTTTSTTTTTTARPTVTIIPPPRDTHDRRDSRSYETSTGPQSNGLQQSAHGAHKWQSLNTYDGTKDSKGHGQQNNRNGKSAEIKEALQHAIKVSREGSCQWPRARVVPVRDVYPSPSTTYIPHCAILHRCSDDTGCCRSEALTCVPKVSHRVELYFYTTSVGGTSVVEKLSFYNHTECECKERSEYGASSDKTTVTNEHRFTRHHPPATSPPQNIRRPPQKKSCKCPSEFTPRITPEGECQCNCFENDQNCIRTRRGKGYFSLRDRLCIQNEECATPVCEFGEYMRRQGKCPRKRDKFDDIARYPTNLHHRFRS